MPSQRTFVLGLGCQKGGTTWLNRYLAESPQFEAGFRKEYHLFNHLDLEGTVPELALHKAKRTLERMAENRPVGSGWLLWASFFADSETYFDYFAGVLTRPGIRASGDITPMYAQLSSERLVDIRERFAARGIRTVAIFLMRDPVERVWSSVRMHRKNMRGARRTPERVVRLRYADPWYADRTRYDQTLAAIDAAFHPDDVFVEFYERLFDEATLRRLTDLVDMDFHLPDLGRRIHATARTAELPRETARLVANHFRPVYEDVAGRFPDVDLEQVWPSAALLDQRA